MPAGDHGDGEEDVAQVHKGPGDKPAAPRKACCHHPHYQELTRSCVDPNREKNSLRDRQPTLPGQQAEGRRSSPPQWEARTGGRPPTSARAGSRAQQLGWKKVRKDGVAWEQCSTARG